MIARCFSLALRCALKEREFRAARIARDHERPSRIAGPALIFRNDFQTEDVFVPLRRLVTIRHEQLHMVNLIGSESVAPLRVLDLTSPRWDRIVRSPDFAGIMPVSNPDGRKGGYADEELIGDYASRRRGPNRIEHGLQGWVDIRAWRGAQSPDGAVSSVCHRLSLPQRNAVCD